MKAIGLPLILITGLLITVGSTHATVVDHSLFAGLLDRHLKEGMVNYKGFQQDEAILDQYLDQLAEVDPDILSNEEQFAFYANAYNAWTVKLIHAASGLMPTSEISELR